ncbi:MAG TPA: CheR family methyltransferase [Gallionellaceae bacterium]|nr:MAG: hypothetical protein B7Y04_13690 [Gallionellales bacterium 24-53-125]OZB09994.1 MAG: hypothetical protein B7X61_05595 [Gallionellales bacterium 39-52-133]HQS73889.1 CheR family methyltransferase [Gallionellaceae bacterium]
MQTILPPFLLTRLSELLADHTGLHFPAERWGDLERGITSAASILGFTDTETCVQKLVSLPLTQHEIGILASCLTVGETYFFREKRCFEVLEQNILPALFREREETGQHLRIWSAGCCTGEEPYSVAMLIDRMIPRYDRWNVTLLASDINPAFLKKAADGVYSEWSFRSTPEWIRDRYFSRGKAGQFKLDAKIRQRVSFSSINLAEDSFPSPINNTNAMDIIFCRNVLMYFSEERVRSVIGNFHRALVDGGWLIVSPAETSCALFASFSPVNFGGAVFYRKSACAETELSPLKMPQMHAIPAYAYLAGDVTPAQASRLILDIEEVPLVAAGEANMSSLPGDPVLLARECANQGRLDEAAEWCRKAIAADKLDSSHHYLLAIIELEQGQQDAAAQTLVRALYLKPDFVLAHYALGNLRRSQGRHDQAERHFDNTLALLRAYQPSDILPETDGLTAGRMTEIIMAMRAEMAQPPMHL